MEKKDKINSEIKINNKEKEEKNIKEDKNEEVNPELDKKAYRQTAYFFGILGFLLVALFAGAWVNYESKKFDYLGYTFQKENFGEIPIYSTTITGYGVNGMPMNFKLILRNNPTKIDIPIQGNIKFLKNSPVYLSINSSQELEGCGDGIALISFGYFMTGLGFSLKTAAPSEELAQKGNQEFVDCKNTPDSTVLILTSGNQTKITQSDQNPNCYILSVNKCETIPLMEKFEIATLANIKGKKV